MNIENKTCRFNLGFEMEASGSKTINPYNFHIYLCNKCISISPTKFSFPLRLAFGFRKSKQNVYLNFGILDWNILFEYKGKELMKELTNIIKNICPNKFTISIINILKVQNNKFYIIPFGFKGS